MLTCNDSLGYLSLLISNLSAISRTEMEGSCLCTERERERERDRETTGGHRSLLWCTAGVQCIVHSPVHTLYFCRIYHQEIKEKIFKVFCFLGYKNIILIIFY